MDFTLNIYNKLLKSLKSAGYQCMCFENFLTHNLYNIDSPSEKLSSENDSTHNEKTIIIRHDVDQKAENSLKTAIIENKLDISATYYFRIVKQSNIPEIIKKIRELGHEIGYHYEDLALNKGNFESAIECFVKNIEYFRQYYPIKTICMHGNPLSKYDNRKLWNKYNYHDFGIIGEPYFDVDFSKVLYLTDTGRRWNGEKVSFRDKVKKQKFNIQNSNKSVIQKNRIINFRTTFDIIKAAENNDLPEKIMLTTHPQRWSDNSFDWVREFLMQNFKNVVKRGLVKRFV